MLWYGNVSKLNESITLTHPCTDYKFLSFQLNCFGGAQYHLFNPESSTYIIRSTNVGDSELSINIVELQLTRSSTTRMRISLRRFAAIEGGGNADDTQNVDSNNYVYLQNIIGIK